MSILYVKNTIDTNSDNCLEIVGAVITTTMVK